MRAYSLTSELETLASTGEWTRLAERLPAFAEACQEAASPADIEALLTRLGALMEEARAERTRVGDALLGLRHSGRALGAYADNA